MATVCMMATWARVYCYSVILTGQGSICGERADECCGLDHINVREVLQRYRPVELDTEVADLLQFVLADPPQHETQPASLELPAHRLRHGSEGGRSI